MDERLLSCHLPRSSEVIPEIFKLCKKTDEMANFTMNESRISNQEVDAYLHQESYQVFFHISHLRVVADC